MIPLHPIIACATCEATSALVGGDAAKWSILLMLFLILPLLGGIGFFMWRMAVREREHLDPQLSDDYVPDSSN